MTDHTKQDNVLIGCGYGLICCSVFVLGLLIIGVIDGSISKLPIDKQIIVLIGVNFCGLGMAIIGTWWLVKEYEKPKTDEVK